MNECLLILADFVPKKLTDIQTIGLQEIDLEKLFEASKNKTVKGQNFLFVHPDVERIFKGLLDNIDVIKAAGGLVKNGEGEYLFIHRLGKWDLPKGKVEDSEKMREAAVREVEEECGVKIDYLGPKIHTSYHTYNMRGKFILKQTNWYEMSVNKSPKLIPQLEEDITEAKWVAPKNLGPIRANTYALILDIIKGLK